MAIEPLIISHYTLTNALGSGKQASLDALRNEQTGLRAGGFETSDIATYIGEVDGLDAIQLPDHLSEFTCRNNHLALQGLLQDGFDEAIKQAREKYHADRIGVFLGTSTSGILATEHAYQHRNEDNTEFTRAFDFSHTHNIFSLADFVQKYFALTGPALVVSTACSSSIKVFASAYRHIQSGLCDAAIVGGVDSLCLTTLYGFNSLQLVSDELCCPWDMNRKGINIGEAAGFALLEKTTDASATNEMLLFKGYGESSDAYHMSTPHPQGQGAQLAMKKALHSAGLQASDIDYINLHGTSTKSNDASEDAAICALFGDNKDLDAIASSSTKAWTGHTLGAAGITEVGFACLALENNFMPGSLNTQQIDPVLKANINLHSREAKVNTVLSNSFGFGGSNCSVIISRT